MSSPSAPRDDDAAPPAFEREAPAAGELVRLSPLVRRLVCPNPGPFTFTGTCTYVVGEGEVAVIDPGPAEAEGHRAALLSAIADEHVTHVVVTHTHRDHSPGARPFAAAVNAPIVGCGPHRAARALNLGETSPLEGSGDREHRPDRELADGEAIHGPGWTLTALATPGHAMNHLAFAFPEENALFSGDHVMGWSTTIVAPPDGAMGPYMASLERLRDRPEAVFYPGHGGPVRDPRRFVRALIQHRRAREAGILARLAAGDRAIPEIVAASYAGLAPALRPAAGLSVFAHLEDLLARGLVACDGPPTLDTGSWRVAAAPAAGGPAGGS